jgi:AraC-like DNA-binding protein
MPQYSDSSAEFDLHEFISRKYPGYAADSAYAGRIADYIISAFPEKLSEAEIASNLNITPRWLQQECKKSFGVTYGNLFRNIRINAGVSLMYYTRLSYTKIASLLNYTSEGNMVRDFKRQLGLTPTGIKIMLKSFSIKNIKLPDVLYLKAWLV